MDFDLVIRGGVVVDGTGAERRDADVGVADGRIAAVGRDLGRGAEEIDAKDRIVAPGFVDIHTHYDGQATWASRMNPSSLHGVTTVVMGNCGVGFAPCRADDHDRLIKLMEGVEDIPFPVLAEGLPWNWESYPDYLDALSARAFDVDIASQLPHAAVRVFVMGERGSEREPATSRDIEAMGVIAERAAAAGALGFSTSRTLNHRTSEGKPTPTLTAGEDELTGIALGLKRAGAGVLQVVSDFADEEIEFAMLRRIVERSGRPLSFTLVQSPIKPQSYKLLLSALEDAVAAGLPMKAQVAPRPVGVLLGLELTVNPFTHYGPYKEIARLPLAERVERLRDPAFRERLFAGAPQGGVRGAGASWARMHLMDPQRPDYEPGPETTVAATAQARGREPAEVALDHMLERGGRGMLYVPFLNYAEGTLDPALAMLVHPHTVPGLSDGGAHVGMICDGSFPTTLVTHWTRDRARGGRLALEEAIRMQTRDTALTVGLADRGVIAPGYRADLNLIDYDRLAAHSPTVVYDLPSGGRRLEQKASGYAATIVAGALTYRDGEPTGNLPGRLVRGAQPAPAIS
ncbi:MAG TPA: amidohydrolase family protein [Caulobacteraceae bacterium]|nr:amidohydrolase family protein [Caulobacteraceae bacterium]